MAIKKIPIKFNVKGTIPIVRGYILGRILDKDYENVKFMLEQFENLIRNDERGFEVV